MEKEETHLPPWADSWRPGAAGPQPPRRGMQAGDKASAPGVVRT